MDRFEIVDMTIDESDPRYKIWDLDNQAYLPGYWVSEEAAIEAANAEFLPTTDQE